MAPHWSPDGRYIAYRGTRAGLRNVWRKAVDEATGEEQLTTSGNMQTPGSWSRDGQWLLYLENDPATASDIWAVPAAGDRQPRVVVRTRFVEAHPRLSPDGRWLAYTSNEPGLLEVFVQPFVEPGSRVQISTEGGPNRSGPGKDMSSSTASATG